MTDFIAAELAFAPERLKGVLLRDHVSADGVAKLPFASERLKWALLDPGVAIWIEELQNSRSCLSN